MQSSRLLVACVLGLGFLTTLAPVRAAVQKSYTATTDSSLVWIEQEFAGGAQDNSTTNTGSEVLPTLSFIAGFAHPGKKYAPPTRTFFGIIRKFQTTSTRSAFKRRRFVDATQMVVSAKGNRTTLNCTYGNDHERDGDNIITTEKMVSDVSVDLLKQMGHAHKVTVGFLSSKGDFLGEYSITETELADIDDLANLASKDDSVNHPHKKDKKDR